MGFSNVIALAFGILVFWYFEKHKTSLLPSTTTTTTPTTTTTTPTTTTTTPTTTTSTVGTPPAVPCNEALMAGIAVKDRLQFNNCVTVTGTIVGEQPHFAPDGDMVFSLKLDPPFQSLVNDKNNDPKYLGGIWCEVICVQENKSPEVWHKGDCAQGGPFYKPTLPKTGDRMQVTGIHALDTREGGHAEIHPVTDMKVLPANSTTTPPAASAAGYARRNQWHQAYLGQMKENQEPFVNYIRFSNLKRYR